MGHSLKKHCLPQKGSAQIHRILKQRLLPYPDISSGHMEARQVKHPLTYAMLCRLLIEKLATKLNLHTTKLQGYKVREA